ncbi:MAG: SCO family protein [Bryobacterales bacterium]|nr:SCO family protein [Bryobacterales bacterium]
MLPIVSLRARQTAWSFFDGAADVHRLLPRSLSNNSRGSSIRACLPRRPSFLGCLLLASLLSTSCAKRYHLQGLVLEVRPTAQTIVVSHKAIPGVMPAMAMPLRVANPREISGLVPGTFIDFQLANSEARRIRPRRATNEIEQDGRRVLLEPPKEKLAIGGLMPEWSLLSHRDERISVSALRGKVLAIQFLYTRCPLPEVCPRLAATFARLQRRFPDRMNRDLILMSITLDPTYDTPPVLSRYATLWRPQLGWHFLTGSESEVRVVANRFGIIYWPEEGVITHNSTIGIVNRQGRLSALVEGLSFDVQQLGDLIASELEKQ